MVAVAGHWMLTGSTAVEAEILLATAPLHGTVGRLSSGGPALGRSVPQAVALPTMGGTIAVITRAPTGHVPALATESPSLRAAHVTWNVNLVCHVTYWDGSGSVVHFDPAIDVVGDILGARNLAFEVDGSDPRLLCLHVAAQLAGVSIDIPAPEMGLTPFSLREPGSVELPETWPSENADGHYLGMEMPGLVREIASSSPKRQRALAFAFAEHGLDGARPPAWHLAIQRLSLARAGETGYGLTGELLEVTRGLQHESAAISLRMNHDADPLPTADDYRIWASEASLLALNASLHPDPLTAALEAASIVATFVGEGELLAVVRTVLS